MTAYIKKGRLLALLLSAIMLLGLLCGCGKSPSNSDGGEPKNGELGRYIETIAHRMEQSRVLAAYYRDPDVIFYTSKTENDITTLQRNVLKADGSVETNDVLWVNEQLKNGGWIDDLSETESGELYFLYTNAENQNTLLRSKDGQTHEAIDMPEWNTEGDGGSPISIPSGAIGMDDPSDADPSDADPPTDTPNGEDEDTDPEGGGFSFSIGGDGNIRSYNFAGNALYPSGVLGLSDGFLIFYGMDGITQYNASGEKIRTYEGMAYRGSASVYDGKLLLGDAERQELLLFDLETGQKEDAIKCEGLDYFTTYGMDGEGVYMLDSKGISRYKNGGWALVIERGITSLIMPSISLSTLLSDHTGGFYGVLDNDDDMQIAHYYYSAETPKTPQHELNIFALNDSPTIRQAIGEFQRANPDARVNLQVALEDGGSAVVEDVIKTLNAELIAGKGPDLIVLDGLPIDSYIEKGVFKDIGELVNRLTASEGLLENMMQTYAEDGAIYGVPTRFSFPVMIGKREYLTAINTLHTLLEMVEQSKDGEIPLLQTPDNLWSDESMLMNYYESCVNHWAKEDGTIDEAGLDAFLTDMLRLNDVLKEQNPELGEGMTFASMAVAGGSGGFEVIDMGAMSISEKMAQIHIQTLSGLYGFSNIAGYLSIDPEMGLASLFGENTYFPAGAIGVTAAGKNTGLAEKFIETVLSSAVQDSYLFDGYPVNSRSLEKVVNSALEQERKIADAKNAQLGIVGDTPEITDMGFMGICQNLQTPVFIDQVIKSAVFDQISGLLSGSITPAQAAAAVVEKTKLYLAE